MICPRVIMHHAPIVQLEHHRTFSNFVQARHHPVWYVKDRLRTKPFAMHCQHILHPSLHFVQSEIN